MQVKHLYSIAVIPFLLTGIITNPSLVKAATVGSRIDFTGYVYGSLNQMDYIDSSASPLVSDPNVKGDFQVINATGSFAPALTNPDTLGNIRDFTEGGTSGVITQIGPVLNGLDNPDFYVADFLHLTVPNLINYSFQLETVNRTVAIDPNSPNPTDPLITGISATFTGKLINLMTNEVQNAVGTFIPIFPAGIVLSQFTPNNFLGPAPYTGSLEVVSEPPSVPEPSTNVGLISLTLFLVSLRLTKTKNFLSSLFKKA